jgi:heat shock protein HtpX
MNALKTGLLMLAIFAILLFVGAQFGPRGLTAAFIIALAMNGFSYWFSDKIILAMYRAREVGPKDEPRLHRIVRDLAQRAKLPMPRVCVIENPSPNAFATGRNPAHAAVAVTSGIMRLLNDDELAGVIGHELAHVGNRDILIQTVVATVAGAIMFLAYMMRWGAVFGGFGGRDSRRGNPLALLALSIFAPLAAMIVQMMISRTREYAADRDGARIAGDPLQLAGALRKLEQGAQRAPMEAGPATAHLFIVHPFNGRGIRNLFSTHPPIEERIARLEKMARFGGPR